jgi:threonine dehydratase
VFVPENVSPEKARKLEAWGATVVVRGRHWHEANREALALADRDGLA